MRTGLVPQFICSRCQHRCGMVPFYREPGFVACSEGCYDLMRDEDLLEALIMKEEWGQRY